MNGQPLSLVIPGRNCAGTIRACLDASLAIDAPAPAEVVFVNDGSTDNTARIVADRNVRVVDGPGRGAAAARNVGWRSAANPLIWFIDSDCVPAPDAAALLLVHLEDPHVGAVGGSYTNRRPESLLACLIHEEIATRHDRMPADVDFLAGFNVIYRRSVLEEVGGFDESFPAATAEDADLSYRVRAAGYGLRFEPRSTVGHFHETRWWRYLRTQQRHGFWRVRLHSIHKRQAMGDAYSGLADSVQPPLAMLVLTASVATLFDRRLLWVVVTGAVLLLLAQVPMAFRMVTRSHRVKYLAFCFVGFARAFFRGVGACQGAAAMWFGRSRRSVV